MHLRTRFATIATVAAIACAFAAPAFAESVCPQPLAPNVPDGATATKEQLLSVRDDVTAFIKASDEFQSCLNRDVQQKKDEAGRSGTAFDTKIEEADNQMKRSNQTDKERVGQEFNEAVKVFNAAHPAR